MGTNARLLRSPTFGVNVDGCRVEFATEADRKESTAKNQHEKFGTQPITNNQVYGDYSMVQPKNYNPPGRWPANLIHDGSEEVVGVFPDSKGAVSNGRKGVDGVCFGHYGSMQQKPGHGDSGSAARFFYCAKANKRDRNEGCDGNRHPTVKPTELMRYLCRLVTPPNGIILDPFMGSGSTGKAAILENFSFIGIDMEKEYVDIAEARINYVFDMVSRNNQKEQLLDNYFSFNQQEDGEVERD